MPGPATYLSLNKRNSASGVRRGGGGEGGGEESVNFAMNNHLI